MFSSSRLWLDIVSVLGVKNLSHLVAVSCTCRSTLILITGVFVHMALFKMIVSVSVCLVFLFIYLLFYSFILLTISISCYYSTSDLHNMSLHVCVLLLVALFCLLYFQQAPSTFNLMYPHVLLFFQWILFTMWLCWPPLLPFPTSPQVSPEYIYILSFLLLQWFGLWCRHPPPLPKVLVATDDKNRFLYGGEKKENGTCTCHTLWWPT